MVCLLDAHRERSQELRYEIPPTTLPALLTRSYLDTFGNTVQRFIAPPGDLTITSDAIIEDSGLPDPIELDANEVPVEQLPDETLVFLLGSRYCETDQLSNTAWALFGPVGSHQASSGWSLVQAICNFVHQHIRFDYQQARPTRTAWDAYNERVGVCRDFAHLAITLCRCMNIPARYCTGYLGDVGMPPPHGVMDFASWFEAYLGGQWYTFDPRHNMPRIGRVLMAHGRDATDVAITTTFGPNVLTGFTVWYDEVQVPV